MEDLKEMERKNEIFQSIDDKELTPEERVIKYRQVIMFGLAKELNVFYDLHRMDLTRQYISEHFLKFCFDNKLPVKETLDVVNEAMREDRQQKFETVVPQSKRGQSFMTALVLFPKLNDQEGLTNPEHRSQMINDFCEVTGFRRDIVEKQIEASVKSRKKYIIEQDMFEYIKKAQVHSDTAEGKKQIEELVIEAYANYLKIPREEAERGLRTRRERDRRYEREKRKASLTAPEEPDDR